MLENTESSQVITIATVVESATPSESVTAKTLTDLSIRYIKAAALYARLCYEVENRYKPYIPYSLPAEELEELLTEHDAHAISSIFAAVAFLESTINKVFLDIAEQLQAMVDNGFASIPNLENNAINQPLERQSSQPLLKEMVKNWLREKDTGPVLDKFDEVLVSCGKDRFNRGTNPFQDAALLVNLRNALVHYKPTWITLFTDTPLPEAVDNKKLEQLRKKGIPRSPFIIGTERQFFPQQCLSHGHAKWAVNTSLKFADEFFEKMNRPCPYNDVRSRLKTEL